MSFRLRQRRPSSDRWSIKKGLITMSRANYCRTALCATSGNGVEAGAQRSHSSLIQQCPTHYKDRQSSVAPQRAREFRATRRSPAGRDTYNVSYPSLATLPPLAPTESPSTSLGGGDTSQAHTPVQLTDHTGARPPEPITFTHLCHGMEANRLHPT